MLKKLTVAEKTVTPLIVFVSLIGVISYLWYGMLLGATDHKVYVRCLLSVVMYLSTVKYVYDYYCKDDKTAKIYGLLIRYSVAVAGTLMSVHRDSYVTMEATDTLFMLIVVVLMLIPYVTGNLAHAKHNVPLVIVIAVLSTAIAVIKISLTSVPAPLLEYGNWGAFTQYFNEVSQTIQWYSFAILYLLRWREYKRLGIGERTAG